MRGYHKEFCIVHCGAVYQQQQSNSLCVQTCRLLCECAARVQAHEQLMFCQIVAKLSRLPAVVDVAPNIENSSCKACT